MGQCRSKMSEIAQHLPSPSDFYQLKRTKDLSRDKGIYSMDASFSESSFAGGQGLLSTGSSDFEPSSKKKAFDYYGGTIGDSIAEEEEGDSVADDGEAKTN